MELLSYIELEYKSKLKIWYFEGLLVMA